MKRVARISLVVPALALGLALAGCESFDPTAIFEADIFSTKKKLPGERRAVFPEGTPGVPQGVPQELVKGYEPPAEPEPKPVEPKAAAKPKPKPKVVAKPKDEPPPTAVTVRPSPAQTQSQTQSQTQWPDPPPARPQQPATGGWPGSTQPSGQVAWPDPPAPR